MATARRKYEKPCADKIPPSTLHLSIGSDLDVLLEDRKIKSDPLENRNRRTVVVKKENGSFGFTLQSYGLRRRSSEELELLSYVDYVDLGGPAYKAGMRAGDVILSINGESMEDADHGKLVSCIRNCQENLRMVVLFEDVCRKIELHLRYFKLKQVLQAKICELQTIVHQEATILEKVGAIGEDDSSFKIANDSSSLFGSCYFEGEMFQISRDLLTSTPNIHQSMTEFNHIPKSPEVTSVGTPIAFHHSDGMLSPDEVFYNTPYGYGSLPTRSKKKRSKSSSTADKMTGSYGSTRYVGHFVVSSTLFEEIDDVRDVRPLFGNVTDEPDSLSSTETSSKIQLVKEPPSSAKISNKFSSSVPNLLKVRNTGSPLVSKLSKIPRTESVRKLLRSETVNLHSSAGLDPRLMTKQLRHQISNYVVTEDLSRRPDDPQLIGLKQLCNDFRYSCLQQSLVQRRKSVEYAINNVCQMSLSVQNSTEESHDQMSVVSGGIIELRCNEPEDMDKQSTDVQLGIPKAERGNLYTDPKKSRLLLTPDYGKQGTSFRNTGDKQPPRTEAKTDAVYGSGLCESHRRRDCSCDAQDSHNTKSTGDMIYSQMNSRTNDFPIMMLDQEFITEDPCINEKDEVTRL